MPEETGRVVEASEILFTIINEQVSPALVGSIVNHYMRKFEIFYQRLVDGTATGSE